MPEISIIVPVYKVEQFLPECIESILAQTFTDLELLLIDDGSPDNSGKICEEYAAKDSRIRVFHKENGGVSSSRNLGLDNASGKYIMFCDSDDTVSCDWVEKMRNCVSQPDVCIGVCGYNFNNVDGVNRISRLFSFPSFIPCSDMWELHKSRLLHAVWNKIYVADQIRNFNIRFRKEYSYGEDALFVYDYLLINQGQIGICNEKLYNYRVGMPGSLSRKYVANLWDCCSALFEKRERCFEECNVDVDSIKQEYCSEIWRLCIYSLKNYISDSCPLGKKDRIKQIKRMTTSSYYKMAVREIHWPGVFWKMIYQSGNATLIYYSNTLSNRTR